METFAFKHIFFLFLKMLLVPIFGSDYWKLIMELEHILPEISYVVTEEKLEKQRVKMMNSRLLNTKSYVEVTNIWCADDTMKNPITQTFSFLFKLCKNDKWIKNSWNNNNLLIESKYIEVRANSNRRW